MLLLRAEIQYQISLRLLTLSIPSGPTPPPQPVTVQQGPLVMHRCAQLAILS
jgi:hypothetical protein